MGRGSKTGTMAGAPPPTPQTLPMGIQHYFHEIEVLVLHLREEGVSLSPQDLLVVEGWWDARLPLSPVLRGVRRGAQRLARRKKRPRGLKLKTVETDVARELKAMGAGRWTEEAEEGEGGDFEEGQGGIPPEDADVEDFVGDGVSRQAPSPSPPLRKVAEALLREAERLEEECPEAALRLRRVAEQAPSLGVERAYVHLLEEARTFYDARLHALPAVERDALVARVRREAEVHLRRMDPASREETVGELARRVLVAQDPVMDPDRVLECLP